MAGQIGESGEVLAAGSHSVSKRPIWLPRPPDPSTARPPTTQRIAGSRPDVGVIHVLVSSEPPEHRLAQNPIRPWRLFLPVRNSAESRHRHAVRAERIIQFPKGQKTRIGGDTEPWNSSFRRRSKLSFSAAPVRFTHWVPHSRPGQSLIRA